MEQEPISPESDDTSVDEVSDWKEETGRSEAINVKAIDPVLPGQINLNAYANGSIETGDIFDRLRRAA